MGDKKIKVEYPGLHPPWKAYLSDKHKRVFFYNHVTKESTWDLPNSGETPKSLALQGNSCSKKVRRPTVVSKSPNDSIFLEGTRIPKAQSTSDPSCSRSTSNEFLEMEVDYLSEPQHYEESEEEPMEVDVLVEEVIHFRRSNFLHPDAVQQNPVYERSAKIVCRDVIDGSGVLIVFDTCTLLHDLRVLQRCVNCAVFAMIPYVVLMELDGLRKTDDGSLMKKSSKVNRILYDFAKMKTPFILLESSQEAADRTDRFVCEVNDDFILKCAVVTTEKFGNEMLVLFATDDKNLSIKAAASNLRIVSHEEVNEVLDRVSDSEQKKGREKIAEGALSGSPAQLHTLPMDASDIAETSSDVGCDPCQSCSVLSSEDVVALWENGKGTIDPLLSLDDAIKGLRSNETSGVRKRKKDNVAGTSSVFLDVLTKLVEAIVLQRKSDVNAAEVQLHLKQLDDAIRMVLLNQTASLCALMDVVSILTEVYYEKNLLRTRMFFDRKAVIKEFGDMWNKIFVRLRELQMKLVAK